MSASKTVSVVSILLTVDPAECVAAVVELAPRLTVNVVPLIAETIICSLRTTIVSPTDNPEAFATEMEVAAVSLMALDKVVTTATDEVISKV